MGFEPGSLGAMSKWFIHYATTPHLEIVSSFPLQVEDEGIYKCRADFKRSPTKNTKMYLSILSKFLFNHLTIKVWQLYFLMFILKFCFMTWIYLIYILEWIEIFLPE